MGEVMSEVMSQVIIEMHLQNKRSLLLITGIILVVINGHFDSLFEQNNLSVFIMLCYYSDVKSLRWFIVFSFIMTILCFCL